MGNRAECPSCKAYTSNVYSCLNYKCDCECGCPHELLVKWNDMIPVLENLATSKCNKKLLETITKQFEEISILKSKIKKLESIFCWTEILEPLIKAQKILQDEGD